VTGDELERGRAQAEAAFVYRLQSLGGFGGRSDQLNAYNVYRGQPDYFDADLQRYLRASRDGLQHAVARWLDPDRAVALSVVPAGAAGQALSGSVPAGGVR
jgi:zinc protease